MINPENLSHPSTEQAVNKTNYRPSKIIIFRTQYFAHSKHF